MHGLLGMGYMHRLELATSASAMLKYSICSQSEGKCVSVLVCLVMGSIIDAQFGAWFLMKLTVPKMCTSS